MCLKNKFQKFAPFCIIFIISFSSCSRENTGKEEKTELKKQTTDTQTETKPLTTLEKLQGKWKSLEDSRYVLEIKETTKIEYYDNEIMQTKKFEILDKCKSGYVISNLTGEFIDDGELCYRIEEVTDQNLTLLYTGRGNFHRFKKIK